MLRTSGGVPFPPRASPLHCHREGPLLCAIPDSHPTPDPHHLSIPPAVEVSQPPTPLTAHAPNTPHDIAQPPTPCHHPPPPPPQGKVTEAGRWVPLNILLTELMKTQDFGARVVGVDLRLGIRAGGFEAGEFGAGWVDEWTCQVPGAGRQKLVPTGGHLRDGGCVKKGAQQPVVVNRHVQE